LIGTAELATKVGNFFWPADALCVIEGFGVVVSGIAKNAPLLREGIVKK
jgi:hypothetical protein